MGSNSSTAWTETQIPDQTGRVFAITGANSGIGFEASELLAARGATVIMCCRDTRRGEDAMKAVQEALPLALRGNVVLEQLDVSSLASVKQFVDRVERANAPFTQGLDVLILNAGVMNIKQRELSADGFEMQWATNHIGHFALVTWLLPTLRRSVRVPTVVPVSSILARNGRLGASTGAHFDFKLDAGYSPEPVYSDTKQSNLLFATELNQREGTWLRVMPCHPGVCSTNLFRHGLYGAMSCLFQSAHAGAMIEVRAATDATLPNFTYVGTGGQWKSSPVVETPAPGCVDVSTARWLWNETEVLLRGRC